MSKCKVIETNKIGDEIYTLLEFEKPFKFKIGDILSDSNKLEWETIKVINFKPNTFDEATFRMITLRWDCILKPLNSSQMPVPGDTLYVMK